MSLINRSLARHSGNSPIGLGKKNELRAVLQHFIFLLRELRSRHTHMRELVAPWLPHCCGHQDSCGTGCGGVWLPGTEWMPPIVWYIRWPADIQHKLLEMKNQGGVTVNDGEMAATLLQHFLLEMMRNVRYLSTMSFSDNTPTVGQHDRQATSSDSPVPDRFLRGWATRRHCLHSGPNDIPSIEGRKNNMADVASRDTHLSPKPFLHAFANTFPLPPQLGSWTLALLPSEVTLLVFSVMRREPLDMHKWTAPTGKLGKLSLLHMDKESCCPPCKETVVPWNAKGCAWPLLDGSAKVDTTMANKLQGRRSRTRYEHAPRYSSTKDIKIPVDLQ